MAEVSNEDVATGSVPEPNGTKPVAETNGKKLSASEKRKQRAKAHKLAQRAERSGFQHRVLHFSDLISTRRRRRVVVGFDGRMTILRRY